VLRLARQTCMARWHSMSRYGADKLLSPMVNAVRSRNLASISRWDSEKCQNDTGEVHALSEMGCMSATDISSELQIVVLRLAVIETGENGVKRDAGHNPIPVADIPFWCEKLDGALLTRYGASSWTSFSIGSNRTWKDPCADISRGFCFPPS
jgi:hypothetical protein